MREQFIPDELALELKELGFNERCLKATYYNFEGRRFDFITYDGGVSNTSGSIKYDKKSFTIPPWQQAFDFCLKRLEGYTLEHDSDWDGHVQKPCGNGFTFSSKDECLKGLIELIRDKI